MHRQRGGLSRRSVLRSSAIAGGALLGGVGTVVADPGNGRGNGNGNGGGSQVSISVLTYNLYLGANLFRLFDGGLTEFPEGVYNLFEDIQQSEVERRLSGIANYIQTAQPDLVGLQEVPIIYKQTPSDYSFGNTTPNAETVVYDFLDILLSYLPGYSVGNAIVNADEEFPADDGFDNNYEFDVRLTDRDVILVREGVQYTKGAAENFAEELVYPNPLYPFFGDPIRITRGYCVVDAVVDNAEVRFANTHLEASDKSVRTAQAAELGRKLEPKGNSKLPVVLVGDINSGPKSSADSYDILTQTYGFGDAYTEANQTDRGFTCCHDEALRDPNDSLSRRIDVVFSQGAVTATNASTVEASLSGSGDVVWPSDHAGVHVDLQVEAGKTNGGGPPAKRTKKRQLL